MHPVTIGERAMELDELLAVAVGAPVTLDDEAKATIAASRGVIDRMLERDEPVYGLNTGVGHLKDTRLPIEELRTTQHFLLMSHAAGLGDPAPTELVRAAMAARLNGIARGGAGASPAVADVIVAMLNAGVHPVVPSRGSVGAGDLGQLATVGQVAIGAGRAELRGEVMPGAKALELVGIEPLRLEPKDGLTFMSSNAFSIAGAALALDRAGSLADLADVVAALSMEATAASPSVVHPAVAEAKPLGGQRASADTIRGALEGGDLAAGLVETSVQAPLSFRVIPQVHGAVRGSLDAAARAALVELNGRGDNPLVSIEDGAMIHNGNFDAVAMAIAFDQVRLALAHLGHLSERRMSHLWDAFFAASPPAPPPEGAGEPDGPHALPDFLGISERYPAAASWAELRRLAGPATLDVPPLDLGIEDVASNAPASVAATDDALDLVEELLSIEVLMASDVLATRPSRRLGTGTASLLDRTRDAIASLGEHATPAGAQRAVAEAIRPPRPRLGGR